MTSETSWLQLGRYEVRRFSWVSGGYDLLTVTEEKVNTSARTYCHSANEVILGLNAIQTMSCLSGTNICYRFHFKHLATIIISLRETFILNYLARFPSKSLDKQIAASWFPVLLSLLVCNNKDFILFLAGLFRPYNSVLPLWSEYLDKLYVRRPASLPTSWQPGCRGDRAAKTAGTKLLLGEKLLLLTLVSLCDKL